MSKIAIDSPCRMFERMTSSIPDSDASMSSAVNRPLPSSSAILSRAKKLGVFDGVRNEVLHNWIESTSHHSFIQECHKLVNNNSMIVGLTGVTSAANKNSLGSAEMSQRMMWAIEKYAIFILLLVACEARLDFTSLIRPSSRAFMSLKHEITSSRFLNADDCKTKISDGLRQALSKLQLGGNNLHNPIAPIQAC